MWLHTCIEPLEIMSASAASARGLSAGGLPLEPRSSSGANMRASSDALMTALAVEVSCSSGSSTQAERKLEGGSRPSSSASCPSADTELPPSSPHARKYGYSSHVSSGAGSSRR